MQKRDAGRRGILFYLLAGLVVSVWGYVALRLTREIDRGAAAAEHVEQHTPAHRSRPVQVRRRPPYRGDFRDPFAGPGSWGLPVAGVAPAPLPESQPIPEVPPLALLGIVDRVALLQEEGVAMHFASVGETVAGVRILGITADHVVAEFDGQRLELHLDTR